MAQPVINNIEPNGASEGEAVTITGNNFGANQGSGKTVWGTVEQLATAATWNNTLIQTTVPSGITEQGKGILVKVVNDSLEESDGFYFWIEYDNPIEEDVDYQIPGTDSIEDLDTEAPGLAEAKDINRVVNILKKVRDTAKTFAGIFEQATVPTTSQVTEGKWAFWFDTGNNKLFQVFNQSGQIHGVELTVF